MKRRNRNWRGAAGLPRCHAPASPLPRRRPIPAWPNSRRPGQARRHRPRRLSRHPVYRSAAHPRKACHPAAIRASGAAYGSARRRPATWPARPAAAGPLSFPGEIRGRRIPRTYRCPTDAPRRASPRRQGPPARAPRTRRAPRNEPETGQMARCASDSIRHGPPSGIFVPPRAWRRTRRPALPWRSILPRPSGLPVRLR
ncbi:hypothetical protein D3C72_1258050 [compost metagenome]